MQMLTLQIVTAIVCLFQKIFLLSGKKLGWVIGIVGGLLALAYNQLLGLYIYMVLGLGGLLLSIYGIYRRDKKSVRVELLVRASMILVMFVITFFIFRGLMTVAEFVSSLLFLSGIYFLASLKVRLGWLLVFFAHLIAIHIFINLDQQIFAGFQAASAAIALVGIFRKRPF
jgi:hypothetical protein